MQQTCKKKIEKVKQKCKWYFWVLDKILGNGKGETEDGKRIEKM